MPESAGPPEILAPAGDRAAFLAALSAGADAIYLGLKNFSARMQAENFSLKDLSSLTDLARTKGTKVYVAFNTILKPDDLDAAGRLVDRLERSVSPAALIVQDLAMVELARQVGFSGELHLSTLANVTHPQAARCAFERFGVSRVVLPRELGLDEIKAVAAACPDGLDLEAFVHGALCYAVSGRCYWSSYMGGKSGLRGRCVQPCRRTYEHQGHKARFFSCMDLSLDVLAKTLAAVPKVRALKIEGRKKGPHYVFYTVRAYRTLLDHPTDPEAKKMALDLLDQALGRPTTHYGFLPQRPRPAVEPGTQTGSGRLVGKVLATPKDGLYVSTRERLLQGDLLRVGYEDEPWHQTLKVRRGVPKQGRLDFRPEGSDPRSRPRSGTPVFLVDRREPELMARIAGLDQESRAFPGREVEASDFAPAMPHPASRRRPAKAQRSQDLDLYRRPPHGKVRGETGLWLGPDSPDLPQSLLARAWFSLPPVIWPDEEEATAGLVRVMLGRGATRFLLNAPWQLCLFDGAGDRAGRKGGDGDLLLYAGPFCNLANGLALGALAAAGFHGAVVSPELSREDYLALPGQSPLPLGIVVHGPWPLAISRTMAEEVKAEEGLRSPKGETCWTRRIGQNHWIFPDWELDLDQERAGLERAGYSLFIRLHEPWPKSVDRRERTSRFNLDLRLL